jgi:hypothetical protein
MATKKLSKSHSSTRKKRAATAPTSSRPKKAAATKARKSAAKPKPPKPKKETPEQFKKRMELTQQIFDMAYEANQRGEFWRF